MLSNEQSPRSPVGIALQRIYVAISDAYLLIADQSVTKTLLMDMANAATGGET